MVAPVTFNAFKTRDTSSPSNGIYITTLINHVFGFNRWRNALEIKSNKLNYPSATNNIDYVLLGLT